MLLARELWRSPHNVRALRHNARCILHGSTRESEFVRREGITIRLLRREVLRARCTFTGRGTGTGTRRPNPVRDTPWGYVLVCFVGLETVVEAEDVFAREKAAFAAHRKLAAGVGPKLVDAAAIIVLQVAAALRRKQRENDSAVFVTLRVGRLCEFAAAALFESGDVLVEKHNLVVLAAGCALCAIEGDLARASLVDGVALGASLDDPQAVARNERRRKPFEGAFRRDLPSPFPHVVNRPCTKVVGVALRGLREDEDSALLVLPDDGMTAGANVCRGFAHVLGGEASNDGTMNGGDGHEMNAAFTKGEDR
jgi:hypothetical protein